MSTVCVDLQEDPITQKTWQRLTLPLYKGIDALEQLVMSRLMLFSYLYHHQKVRGAEVAFERQLAREYLATKQLAGIRSPWDLFAIQDAHLYAMTGGQPGKSIASDIAFRSLPRRVAEFREQDVTAHVSTGYRGQSLAKYRELSTMSRPGTWDEYAELIRFEDSLGAKANLPPGTVIVDFPKDPDYGELESLVLPGRSPDIQTTAKQHLSYNDWIQAYNKHRIYARVFAFGDDGQRRELWTVLVEDFAERKLTLHESLRMIK